MFLHLQRLANLPHDWLIGISTRGTAPTDYASVNYSDTREVLHRLRLGLQPSDIFVDVRAGKGRLLCLAARYNLRRVIGVEYSSELVAIAKRNVDHMRGKRSPVEVHSQAAEEFDYSDATVLYFFNPFEANVLDVVLHKLKVDRAGRALRLAFVMESLAQQAVSSDHEWLMCYGRWVDRGGHLPDVRNLKPPRKSGTRRRTFGEGRWP